MAKALPSLFLSHSRFRIICRRMIFIYVYHSVNLTRGFRCENKMLHYYAVFRKQIALIRHIYRHGIEDKASVVKRAKHGKADTASIDESCSALLTALARALCVKLGRYALLGYHKRKSAVNTRARSAAYIAYLRQGKLRRE